MNSTAIVRSAREMSPKLIAEIKTRFGVNEARQEVDNSLSGGFLVQIGDVVYDFTLKSKLLGKEAGNSYSFGKVLSAGDGIVKANGLSQVMFGEILSFANGQRGVAFNLEKEEVGIIVLGDDKGIQPVDKVTTTGQILSIPVGKELLGRVVDPLGNPVDGKGDFQIEQYNPLEKIAPGVMTRKMVTEPLQTGIKAVDGIIPIGRGQRELIIGDRQTGKTSLALTTLINQTDKKITCVYVSIGQKRSSLAQIISTLTKFGAMENTIIVAATSSDPVANQYFAPYAGTAIAEYFLSKGEDALVVYDDLTKHAWAYRQISLLLRRPSGREAYPGDIFYAHSRLLERACRLDEKHGGGSITSLPIIETQAGDVSAYIPTNVISITDGQIYLESDLFNAGQRPAMNVGTSVSRVGSAAQIKAIKQVAGRLKLDLAQYRELAAFAQFASDLDEKTQKQLTRGEKLTALLRQPWDEPMPIEEQVLVIFAATKGYLDEFKNDLISQYQRGLINYAKSAEPELLPQILTEKKPDEKLEAKMDGLIKDFNLVFKEEHGGGNRQLRRRIKSANNISQITKAMEAVAASKMKKAQTASTSGEPYQNSLGQVISNLGRQLDPDAHPLLKVTEEQKFRPFVYLVISSDRGLCGGFNSNLFRLCEQTIKENDAVILLGKKANLYAQKTSWSILGSVMTLGDAPGYEIIKPAGLIAENEFLSRNVAGVRIIYQKFVNTLVQKPTCDQLLPVVPPDVQPEAVKISQDYIFEPSRQQLLNDVLPYYVYLSIYQAVLSSKAAEQSARMVAMKSASDNAKQVKHDLLLVYNRERQRAITSEISDVVTATLALKH